MSTSLQIEDTVVGTGEIAEAGHQVRVHYTGWLYENGEKGRKFDSSRDRNAAFEFGLGAGMVIRGWDEGVAGMKVGGKRKLQVPAHLAYGERSMGKHITPNSDLTFEIELLEVLTRDD